MIDLKERGPTFVLGKQAGQKLEGLSRQACCYVEGTQAHWAAGRQANKKSNKNAKRQALARLGWLSHW